MGQDKGNSRGKRKHHGNKKATADGGGRGSSEQVRAAKAQTNALFTLATSSNPNPKHLGPFSDRQRILVVGDGDLSFSLALAVFLGGQNIVATCYDSQRDAKEKYTNALLNADALEAAGASVHFDVDATALEDASFLHSAKFDAVVFNFPHLGGATEDDVVKNQVLLRDFFYSARSLVHTTRGVVLVALRNTLFYNRWAIRDQAHASGYTLQKTLPFNSHIYAGYEPQRTHPASFRGDPPSTTGAHYYVFALDARASPVDPRSASNTRTHDAALTPPSSRARKQMKTTATPPSSSTKLACRVCSLQFTDVKKFNAHMNAPKHARRVKAAHKATGKTVKQQQR